MLEQAVEKDLCPEGVRERYLSHYSSENNKESVTLVRVSETVSMRLLDLLDLWDLFKIYLRVVLFHHERYGHEMDDLWEIHTRPCRWGRDDWSFEDQDDKYRSFEGVKLYWPAGV